jgi:Coenzyme PQQ synthesis protein D (PqqD)
LTLNDSVRIPDQVASRKIGDETVLLNLETGTYFGLDAVGSRFLELLEQNGDLAAAHRAMLQEFEVAPKVLEADLLRLSEEMCAKGLLEVGSSPTATRGA